MGEESPREACGLFGVWAPDEEVAKLIYFGLYALQHRGQESAGIAVAEGSRLLVHKDMGLVSQIFSEQRLAPLQGSHGIGHTRYSTTGSNRWENAQPSYKPSARGAGIALGHNGNLTNTRELAAMVHGKHPGPRATTDSDIVAALLAEHPAETLEDAIVDSMPKLRGAYSFVMLDEQAVYGVRDPNGIRPLCVGRLPGGGWVIASETCALDIVGAKFVRDVDPGELVVIDETGLRARPIARPDPKMCIFEYVYLARPDSVIEARNVHEVRREMGRLLAREAPAEADLVIGVPDTGPVAAAGFAEESGIPYGEGIVKNRYVGRTFIEPTQTIRQLGIRLKLNPLRAAIRNKRLIVVDDSIVRGNTTMQIVKMLREAGAREVHLRITSPPIRWPCFYGIDMGTKQELVAADLEVEQIRQFVGADSLAYLSLASLVQATSHPAERFCRACFDGVYPVDPPETEDPKMVLEGGLLRSDVAEASEARRSAPPGS